MSNNNNSNKISALLHILSVNRTKFQFPAKKFRDYLEDILDDNPSREIEKYKREFTKKQEQLKKINLKISPLSIGLYNATVDTGSPTDIKKILDKVKQIGLVSENGIKVTEFTIRYGKFQTALSFTSEYGLVGDETKPFVSADFQIKVTKGGETKGASLSYYKSGKVRFSGGHLDSLDTQPKELLEFFSKHYHKVPTSGIKINNVTSEFRLGFKLKTSLIYDMFSDADVKSSFNGIDVVAKYNEKKFLYLTFGTEFSIVVSDTGVIQIQGTTDVEHAYSVSKKFFEALKDNDFLLVSSNQQQNTDLKKPKKTKIAKRHDNMPAPNITRRGTTCPVGRRPDPYSYEGKCTAAGCYIKPNPQGQPCCYTVPKSIKYSKNKVANAYVKAGVRVPNSVRKMFEIGNSSNRRPVNVANTKAVLKVKTFVNNKSGFKINSRQCLRYTKVALVDIATRLKIVLPTKITKPILCDLIKKSGSNKNKNKSKVVFGTGEKFRLGKIICLSYKKETLVKFARELGGDTEKLDKDKLCKLIEKLSKKKGIVGSASASSSPNENFNYFMKGPKHL